MRVTLMPIFPALALVLGVAQAQTFEASGEPLVPGGRSIAFARFDPSGVTVDLALANVRAGNASATASRPAATVWGNGGDGTFTEIASLDATTAITALRAFLPGSEVLSSEPRDLLAAYQRTDEQGTVIGSGFAVLKNDGTGRFSRQPAFHQSDDGGLGLLSTGDLDGDGDQDVVATVENRNGATWVFENTGDARSASFTQRRALGAGASQTVALAVADLDNNGYPEIIEANAAGPDKGIVVWENDNSASSSPWTFQAAAPLALGEPGKRITDMDLSGSMDGSVAPGWSIAASYAGQGEPGIRFWHAATAMDFQLDGQALYACASQGVDTEAVDFADIDSDGDQDLLGAANCGDNELLVYVNDGDNRFGDARLIDVHPANATPLALSSYLGLDLDRSQDLVMTFDDDTARVLFNSPGSGGGDGAGGGPGADSGGGGGGGALGMPLIVGGLLGLLGRRRRAAHGAFAAFFGSQPS